LDAAMLRVSPGTYNAVIHDYQTPVVGVMEYGLVAAVVFHGLNGIRVILVDFWSQGPRYQRVMFWVVGAVFVVVMVPAGVVIGVHMWEHVR
jgi:succinate dehydrogenase / fumarate reductase, cytochrome b subunit